MVIALGSDHAGFELKEAIKAYLIKKGYEVLDEGTHSLDRVDYPVYGKAAAMDVVSGKAKYGIVCCGSAEGISIAANKVKGIRCGIGYNDDVSRLIRQHNNANMIAFAGRFMSVEEVLPRVDLFLNAEFEGGRHAERVQEISDIENC
ncbi:MAG: ribose 5-phosphate isomerase B [Bacilli bacterium]|jgi:ribose 5-phosphate isomerase B|nr:ribose 5-phosphate isomerase B [Bacilli bacterium]MCH4210167.1 ribose 5-phosphate isomerase B [Bacilli bacterium]MCH4278265.1 ribose 5-phosphate isomerase B [Bacilli bacterium]MCI2055403.1 ribose 5-phosphate isomerase B [Bacilli bacterium]